MNVTIVAQPVDIGQDEWLVGFNAYMDGVPLEEVTEKQRKGWLAANKAEAHATMPGGLSAKDVEEYAEEYESWQMDVEWMRAGM